MVTIPPIKIVIWGIDCLLVFYPQYPWSNFAPIILNRQIHEQIWLITLSCHPMEHVVSWLMTALWHSVMYPTVKSPNCRAIVLARDESSFWLFELYNHYFWTCCFLFNLPKTCHQGAHVVVAATGYSSLQLAGLQCIWDETSWWFRKTSRKQWFKHPKLLVLY